MITYAASLSSRRTLPPLLITVCAALRPASPPPMMITCALVVDVVIVHFPAKNVVVRNGIMRESREKDVIEKAKSKDISTQRIGVRCQTGLIPGDHWCAASLCSYKNQEALDCP